MKLIYRYVYINDIYDISMKQFHQKLLNVRINLSKKRPEGKINQTPCGESCWLLTKVEERSEKVLTGELATIKPS